MRIAYISYEYPPDTAVGGIATYVDQVANLMAERGHAVEVFCASYDRNIVEQVNGIRINRVLCNNRNTFHNVILSSFKTSHQAQKFDIIESPEFSADGISIKQNFPEIPLVVKLHTPWFLIGEINNTYLKFGTKINYMASGLIRARWYKPYWRTREVESDPDYLICKMADQIHTPSLSLGDIISSRWKIPRETILNIPYPYSPNDDLLSISAETDKNRITYVGRLEIRKGLVELAKAIKIVLRERPDWKFRFVGKVQDSPQKGMDMKSYLLSILNEHQNSLEFSEVVGSHISGIYRETDICVFPSIWENFPNTCLEAMSAARGIVASKNGGMEDMLKDCGGGILVDPLKPVEIAEALIYLIDHKEVRIRKGKNAREKVITSYNKDAIGAMMEKSYEMLISS